MDNQNQAQNQQLKQRGMIMVIVGVVAVLAAIIAIVVLWGVFYIGAFLFCGGIIMILLGMKHMYQAKQNFTRVQVISGQTMTTQQVTYGQQTTFGQVQPPAYSGPPPPAGGWQNDPYPIPGAGYTPGPPGLPPVYPEDGLHGPPEQPQPPSYGQAMTQGYGQPMAAAYGPPPDHGLYGQPTAPPAFDYGTKSQQHQSYA